jgi:hypothetical protein
VSHRPGHGASFQAVRGDEALPRRAPVEAGGPPGCPRSPRSDQTEPSRWRRVPRVEVRKAPIIEVHRDHNPVEAADRRHDNDAAAHAGRTPRAPARRLPQRRPCGHQVVTAAPVHRCPEREARNAIAGVDDVTPVTTGPLNDQPVAAFDSVRRCGSLLQSREARVGNRRRPIFLASGLSPLQLPDRRCCFSCSSAWSISHWVGRIGRQRAPSRKSPPDQDFATGEADEGLWLGSVRCRARPLRPAGSIPPISWRRRPVHRFSSPTLRWRKSTQSGEGRSMRQQRRQPQQRGVLAEETDT